MLPILMPGEAGMPHMLFAALPGDGGITVCHI